MGFSFQGIHSKEKKLKARITGYPMLPAFRNNTESIPGRSGILDFGMEYSERIIPVECSVFPEQDFSALVHRIDEINGWLNPYRGVQPLIFDEYPDRMFGNINVILNLFILKNRFRYKISLLSVYSGLALCCDRKHLILYGITEWIRTDKLQRKRTCCP